MVEIGPPNPQITVPLDVTLTVVPSVQSLDLNPEGLEITGGIAVITSQRLISVIFAPFDGDSRIIW